MLKISFALSLCAVIVGVYAGFLPLQIIGFAALVVVEIITIARRARRRLEQRKARKVYQQSQRRQAPRRPRTARGEIYTVPKRRYGK